MAIRPPIPPAIVSPLGDPLRVAALPWDGASTARPGILADIDFTTLSAGAVSTIPGGLNFSRAGDGYSVRTGTATGAILSLASNVARAGKDLDSDPIGLVIEEARTQMFKRSEALATFPPWTTFGAGAVLTGDAGVAAPYSSVAGTVGRHVADLDSGCYAANDAGNAGIFTLADGTRYTLSAWIKGPVGGELYQFALVNAGFNAGKAQGGSLTAAWQRLSMSVIGITDVPTNPVFAAVGGWGFAGNAGSVSGGIAAGDRDGHIWGVQMEAGGFPSEYILATASTDVVRAGERLYSSDATKFIRSGRLKMEFQVKPKGASNRYTAAMYLWKAGSDYCRLNSTTGVVEASVGGNTFTSGAGATWSQGDAVDFYVEIGGNLATYAAYRANGGARVLLSTGSPGSLGNVDNTAGIDWLCNDTSGQLSCWFRRMIAYA